MLVLAGPGSGKTTVISERVRYLIEKKSVAPERILTITFTKAAALEMQSRCIQICPRAQYAVFGTFHSVFYHILRKSEKYQKFSLIKEKQKKEIMKKIIPAGNMTEVQHAYICDNVLKKISYIKNSGKLSETEEAVCDMMRRYQSVCEEQQMLDFDDMLLLCRRLLSENEEERIQWQNRFQYILVDEFQDINGCQYEIIKILAQGSGNLFVVGDDDQAIYSFRGSDPGYMRQFLVDYPHGRQVCLDVNYRSGANIVALAGKSICKNQNRFAKKIEAGREVADMVTLRRYDTMERETEAITVQLSEMIKKKNGESMAVLVRTNMQAQYLAERFYQKNIPYSLREVKKSFYEHPWVSDILAVLRFAVCGQRRSDFFAFMNKPFRGLERAMIQWEKVDLSKLAVRETMRCNLGLAEELEKLNNCVKLMQKMDPYGAVMLVLHGMKYDSYLESIVMEDESGKEQMHAMIEELLCRAKKFHRVEEFLEFIKTYTEQAEKQAEKQTAMKVNEKMGDKVQILTYHASKGLEFDHVFLPTLKSGVVPHGHMLTTEQMEEERRMFYVAVTRAKYALHLSYYGKSEESPESVFLKELEMEEIGT